MGVKEEVVSSESSVMGDTAGGMHDYSMYSTPEMESFLSEYSAMEDEGPTEV